MINIKFPLTKTFESSKGSASRDIIFNVARDINGNLIDELKIDTGHVYTLYGNNGIGKTTFMNIISLLTNSNKPYYNKKSEFYYGFDDMPKSNDNKSISRFKYFSFIFQDPHIINMYTLSENMQIVNSKFDYQRDFKLIKEKIQELNDINEKSKKFFLLKIDKFINEKDNTPFYLSGGEKQLLAFIRALIKPSNILFADEPWASMDLHLKEFIELQIYKYINNDDVFSFIRDRWEYLDEQKIAMIISHPTQERVGEGEDISKKIDSMSKTIPVTKNKNDNIKDAQVLHLDTYKKR